MSETKTHHMKMARATKDDLDKARLAYQVLEAYYRDDCTTRKDFSHFEEEEILIIKAIFESDRDENAEVDIEAMSFQIYDTLLRGFFRILWGYQVMFDNACDPDQDTLEFNPWISKSIEVLSEIDEYLSPNPKNYIGSGSILHTKVQAVLKLHDPEYGKEATS